MCNPWTANFSQLAGWISCMAVSPSVHERLCGRVKEEYCGNTVSAAVLHEWIRKWNMTSIIIFKLLETLTWIWIVISIILAQIEKYDAVIEIQI